MQGNIPTWSYSRLEVFEKCAYQAYLKFVRKTDEGADERRDKALKKGRDTHDDAEAYVRGTLDALPPGLKKFETQFVEARGEFAGDPNSIMMEDNWGFTAEWQETGFFDDNVWLRVKLDYMKWLDEEHTAAEMKDYKTGRKDGNEVKHSMQKQLYAVATFIRYPTLQALKATFEYLDHGKVSTTTYTREQAMAYLPSWDRRGKALTTATTFPPKPNRINCKWCPFGPNKGNGMCEDGVEV